MLEKRYCDIRKKYGAFTYPVVTLQVGDKLFSENKHQLVLSSIEVDLSCGLEASAVTYSIYNVYNLEKGCYEFSYFKDYVQLGSAVTVSIGYNGAEEEIFDRFCHALVIWSL